MAKAFIAGTPQWAVALLSHIISWRRLAALVFQARTAWPSIAFIETLLLFLTLMQLSISHKSPAGPALVLQLKGLG